MLSRFFNLKPTFSYGLNFSRLLLTAIILVSLSACGSDRRSGRQDKVTNFRFINAVSDVESVDLYFNSKAYQLDVGYLEHTGYSDENLGPHRLQVNVSKTGAILADTTTGFSDASDQTFIVFGRRLDSRFRILRDNNEPPSRDSSKLRVINTSAENRNLDVYMLKPNVSIDNEPASVRSLNYQQSSSYFNLPKGTYTLTVTNRNSNEILLTSSPIILNGASVYSVLITDSKGGENPPIAVVLKDY